MIGFDIETVGRKNEFYCCSLWSEKFSKSYLDKKSFIYDLKSGVYNDSLIVATNLSFDFFGTFFGEDELKGFNLLFRGSDLLMAKTYSYNRRLNKKASHHKDSITFLDTWNYIQLSVENLGDWLGLAKMRKPKNLGNKPRTKKEKDYLLKYNMRDAEISCRALSFLYVTFESLGATPKLTLASTAMSLFKNKYLKSQYWRHRDDVLLEQHEGYYGGRVEAFCRGMIKDMRYYDVNSLYPTAMLKEYPDPNTLRTTYADTLRYIKRYEGMSKVRVTCPYMHKPLLPYRFKDGDTKSAPIKLLFPCGTFEGWHTHVELRKALELGYTIDKVYKTHYYTKTCSPFKGYITDLYSKRMEYKEHNDPMEKVVKILMNALYGKFGQKWLDKDNLIPFDHTAEELMRYDHVEILGDFIRIKEDRYPPAFAIPIWASYVTSYGRLILYDLIVKHDAVYCDTDSITTKDAIKEGKALGQVKCEIDIRRGIIVKPKFYGHIGRKFDNHVRIKGVGIRFNFKDFCKFVSKPKASYTKFIKIRESLRRGFKPNEIIDVVKELDLEDEKREWSRKFDGTFQESEPLFVGCTMNEKKISKLKSVAKMAKEFEHLPYEERKACMLKVPLKARIALYSKYSTNDELKDLIMEWKSQGNLDAIEQLKQRLNKDRRPLLIRE